MARLSSGVLDNFIKRYDDIENGEIFVRLGDVSQLYMKCSTGPEHHEAVNLLDGTLIYIIDDEEWLITLKASIQIEGV